MSMLSVDTKGRVNLEAISTEDYLTDVPRDFKCDLCGRELSELEPFGRPGDPLMGNYEGELLVKVWRRQKPFVEEYAEAWKEAEENRVDPHDSREWFIRKYKEVKGGMIAHAWSNYNSIEASWECRDCAALSDEEYAQAEERKWEEEMENKRSAS
jgi:hypothetical protein